MTKVPPPTKTLDTDARPEDLPGRAAPSPEETAQYIQEFTTQLGELARHAKLDLLAYLLDMARLEATRLTRDGEAG